MKTKLKYNPVKSEKMAELLKTRHDLRSEKTKALKEFDLKLDAINAQIARETQKGIKKQINKFK